MKYKLPFRTHFVLFLIAAISIGATGQQTPPPAAPSVERLRTHIEYLASDKLEGRRTGSQGANEAARYIADEFKRIGLKPTQREVSLSRARGAVGHYDSHLQPFPYVAGVELGKHNELSFRLVPNPGSKQVPASSTSSSRFVVGEDWMPLGLSSQGRVEKSPAIFVGYGITSNELNYDDYAHGKASGKIAIAFAGTPDGAEPHGRFARLRMFAGRPSLRAMPEPGHSL